MATIEDRVNELIEVITEKMSEMNLDAKKVFLNGNCGNLYTIFAEYFKKEAVVPYEILYEGEPYHIVSKIGEDFYDITGKTDVNKYIKYLREHNQSLKFNDEDFEMKEIGIPERGYKIRKQSNMYAYDDNYNQSTILYQMDRLDKYIKDFKNSKERAEN